MTVKQISMERGIRGDANLIHAVELLPIFLAVVYSILPASVTGMTVVLVITTVACAIALTVFTGRLVSIPALLLGILVILHFGYLIPARLDPAQVDVYLPPVEGDIAYRAVAIVEVAMLAFVSGVAVAATTTRGRWIPTFGTERNPGLALECIRGTAVILVGGAVLGLGVFFLQVGGLGAVLTLNYNFLYTELMGDVSIAYFLVTVVSGLGVGVWLVYLVFAQAKRKQLIRWLLATIIFIAIPLKIGSRGPAFLAVVACCYIYHFGRTKIPRRYVLALVLLGLTLTPILRQLRNGDEMTLDATPWEEMGVTYRPLYIMVELEQTEGNLYLRPYTHAVMHILPKFPLDVPDSDGFFRTIAWVGETENRTDFDRGFGIGGSGVGEPYLAFGMLGVITLFAAMGFFAASVDFSFVEHKNPVAGLLAVETIMAFGWYMRDDVYSLSRLVFWPIAIAASLYIFKLNSSRNRLSSSRTARVRLHDVTQ